MLLRITPCLDLYRLAYSRMLLWHLIQVSKERAQNRLVMQSMRHIWDLLGVQSIKFTLLFTLTVLC